MEGKREEAEAQQQIETGQPAVEAVRHYYDSETREFDEVGEAAARRIAGRESQQ